MSIENLIKAVPPPDKPFEVFRGPWDVIEADLGMPLPQDYKAFARLYGSGYFMGFLGIDIPNTQNPNTRLEWQAQVVCGIFKNDDELPYPMWPAPGGLLPFGSTDDGDYLFWLTDGRPDNWRVVVWDRGFGGFEKLDVDVTDFLAGLATGEVLPKEFPDDLLPCSRLFQPHSTVPQVPLRPGVKLSWRMTPPRWDIAPTTQAGDVGGFEDVLIVGRIAPDEPPE